jgi:hypothetical protein
MPDRTSPSADPRSPAIPLAAQAADRYGLPRRTHGDGRRFPLAMRLVLFAGGGALLVALAVARSLSPDPSGYGTHRQLGLPPCTLVALFGKPCPSCGMTTAWAHLTRGQIRRAASANLGGAVLGVTAMFAAPWLILSAAVGRWLVARPTEVRLIVYAATVAAVIFLDWWL